jgi:hypothetical protein
MADARYIHAVLSGEKGGVWAGEIWQTGISIRTDGEGGGVFWPAVNEALPTWTTHGAASSGTWTHGTYTLGFEDTSLGVETNQALIVAALYDFWIALRPMVPNDSQLVDIRLSAIGSDGKVINGASVYELTTPSAGSVTAANQLPPEVAVVGSLRTGGRGPKARGRMYLPLNAVTASSGQVGSSTRASVVEALLGLISDIEAVGTGFNVAVVHKSEMTFSDVTKVACGNHFDSQRRRQSALPEIYDVGVVTGP